MCDDISAWKTQYICRLKVYKTRLWLLMNKNERKRKRKRLKTRTLFCFTLSVLFEPLFYFLKPIDIQFESILTKHFKDQLSCCFYYFPSSSTVTTTVASCSSHIFNLFDIRWQKQSSFIIFPFAFLYFFLQIIAHQMKSKMRPLILFTALFIVISLVLLFNRNKSESHETF